MKRTKWILTIWILCFAVGFTAEAVRVQVNDVPAIVTTLTATDAVTFEAAFTLNLADPGIVFDPATATDTEFWFALIDDAGSDDDDTLEVGKGTAKGTTPFFIWDSDGGFVARPLADSTSAFVFLDASSNILWVMDSTNLRIGINNATPDELFVVGTGTKTNGLLFRDAAELQTGNAVQQTLNSITLLDNNIYQVEARVTAMQSDASDDATYYLICSVKRSGGGATLRGAVTSLRTQESTAALDATFTVSGNDLRLSVTGIAAETWEWSGYMSYINGSN